MKRFLTIMLLLALVIPASYAQKGLNVGGNFMYLSSFMVNQNTWGNGHEYDFAATSNTSFGLDLGYNFNDNIGIYSGYWMMNLGQNYTDEYKDFEETTSSSFERNLLFKYNVIPVMLKFTGTETRVNFMGGFGILFAMMKDAEQTWTKNGSPYTQYHEEDEFEITAKDVTDRYEKNDIILNLELGARIVIIENLYVDATLNFGYGLKDINAADWQIPNNDGVYSASHNAYAGFKVGVAYVLFGD
ncbi:MULTISPECIES: outer membrane beta-barrel protein [unclassified Lentimicrobium]|uniref:outer membrane beta-barrel protein n=1 Tax=unclassified Lentimicrobium TaxID=2677434 RepID=UPI0015531491|nr:MULTISPECIES: outer membrane beta-barrel protein [unclassified Lentimicrobium]NPD44592.1 outer membrane beta-barrel protein [Lentimicrobium sp. S6]NPD83304.1 outer membrane beta-barrel protein [Lentimicrobium sp. L6]